MNSNMTVGPSFQGTFSFKTVEKLVKGRPVYAKSVEVIKLPQVQDGYINSALTAMLSGRRNQRNVLVASDRFRIISQIANFIKKPLDWFQDGKTLASSKYNPQNMTFSLRNADNKVGDVHLFWESEKPFETLLQKMKISNEEIVELVREAKKRIACGEG